MNNTENTENKPETLRVVVIGVRGMGASQAKILSRLPHFHLTALCDLNREQLEEHARALSVKAYTDASEMLAQEKPDVVAVCTDNSSHAKLTLLAAEAGVRGIYCEKPMATNLRDARSMVETCEKQGAILIINHQRRISPDLRKAREIIDSGNLGEIVVMRAWNAGDILSDGTHAVDSLLWLNGDSDVEWMAGSIFRDPEEISGDPAGGRGYDVSGGFRYGHPIETAGIGVVRLKNGNRLEFTTGTLARGRAYQEYEIVGTKGRLLRTGDKQGENLFLAVDGHSDTHVLQTTDRGNLYVPQRATDGSGPWKPVETGVQEGERVNAIGDGYSRLRETILNGTPHPMNGRNALRGFEIVMGLYESARLRQRLAPPITQEQFPLELLLENENPLSTIQP